MEQDEDTVGKSTRHRSAKAKGADLFMSNQVDLFRALNNAKLTAQRKFGTASELRLRPFSINAG